jgi:hypothetical protein
LPEIVSSVSDHVCSQGNRSAEPLPSSVAASCAGAPTFIASSPVVASLPEVLSDRATGGSLTVSQTLSFLESETGTRIHRATLWRWFLTGRLAHYRVGGKVKTTKRAVLAMLAADSQRGPRSRQRTEAASKAQREEVVRAGDEAARRIEGMGRA